MTPGSLASCSKTFLTAAALGTGLVLLAGCSEEQAGAGGGFRPPPMPVETATVTRRTVSDRFEAVGTIDAGEAITVVSEIDGTVVSIPFIEGKKVARGSLIAKLDDVQLKAEMDRSEALRDQSQSTHDRVKSVVDQGAGTPQDLDDSAAALKVAEAELSLARSRLAKTRITAPFSGITGARHVSPGAFLRAGQTITDLAQIEEIRVIFSAPERFLSKLELGAAVTINTIAFPGYQLDGTIDIIEPVLDQATRSARIIAVAKNPEGKFRPGMSANIVVVLSERAEALTVPSEAVFVEGNQSLAFVVNADSTVTRTPLTLGTRMADAVEVLSGVQEGSRVVRAGHQKLFEGAKIMPISSQNETVGTPSEETASGGDQ